MEDYKKRYEEALERAKKYYNRELYAECNGSLVEDIFPELKESDDEKIKKSLINYIDYHGNAGDFTKLQFIDWVEKQGEQKSNDISPIFRVGDYIRNKKTSDEVLIEQLDIANKAYCYVCYDGAAVNHSDFPFSKQDEWKLIGQKIVEQNHPDKAEPKFKVGDYIINGHGFIMQIDGIDGNAYVYHVLDDDSRRLKYDINKTEKSCHLWTIQDAKDGDVLANENGSPFIFNGFLEKTIVGTHCGITGGIFCIPREKNIWTTRNVLPATKEQRDLLFKKMKEAGYEWDTEKKELNKIEQKSAWSEEDEKKISGILMVLESWDSYHVSSAGLPSLIPDYVSWLKSLKGRVQPQSKQEWSEED